MQRPVSFALAALLVTTALGGCSTIGDTVSRLNPFGGADSGDKAVATAGARVPVAGADAVLAPDASLQGADFFLPDPSPRENWPLPGGTPEQSVEHIDAAQNFSIAWRRSFGEGAGRRSHVTAPPVIADGKVFVMDGEAQVSALDATSGATLWRTRIEPRGRRDRDAFGGGVAYASGKLYVSSGHRVMTQLDAATGAVGWRAETEAPLHAAPTVAGGRVFVVGVDDQLLSFDAATGEPGWTYQALVEPARILAASSPAVTGDTLVATFASGEVVALRAANGNDLWQQALSRASRTNALSEIRDIPGRPVVYQGEIYALSHSGVLAAIDLRTGQPRWSLPIAGVTTPLPVGDVVYATSLAGEIICVQRSTGQVYWIRDLNEGRSAKERRKNRLLWSGPTLAFGRLIVTSSEGQAVALNPKTGQTLSTLKLGGGATLSPIGANGTLYVVTNKAELVAIR